MINEQTRALAAQMLRAKLANEEANAQGLPPSDPAHEAAESPETEMMEHAHRGGEMGEEHPDNAELEHLLSQLSPEELEQIFAHLHGDHAGHPDEAAMHEGAQPEQDTAGLAQTLEQHLANSPEANPEGLPPEKAAAFEFVKSASYIEGFLDHALSEGASIKEAVDLYDSALTETIEDLTKAAGLKKMINKALRPVTAPIAKAVVKHKAKKFVKNNKGTIAGAGAAAVGGAAYLAHKNKNKDKQEEDSEKTAAYYDGVFERAAEYGLSYNEAVDFIKSAGIKDMVSKGADKVKELIGKARQAHYDYKHPYRARARKAYEAAEPKVREAYESAKTKAHEVYEKHPKATVGAGSAAAGAAAGYHLGKKDSEKTAAYFNGMFKQALAYGYSEQDAASFVESALDKSAGIGSLFRKKNVLEKIHDTVAEYGGKAVDAVKKHGPKAYETAKDYAKEHPLTATGVGAGVAGIGVGRLSKKDND